MKKMILLLVVVTMMLLVACTAPPEELPRVNAEDSDDAASDDTQNDVDESAEIILEQPELPVDDGNEFTVSEEERIPEPEPVDGEVSLLINKSISSLEFEGYGPGKSHVGTFTNWDGSMQFTGTELSGAQGTIDVNSVDTGIGGLDSHLLKEEFFDAENYPLITIVSTGINEDRTMMDVDLTFRGVTRSLTIPVTIDANQIAAEFVLNVRDFGVSYDGINDEVRLAFTMVSE